MMSPKQRHRLQLRSIIQDIERNVRVNTKRRPIKTHYDFYSTLPKKLFDRVANIIHFDDNFEFAASQKLDKLSTGDNSEPMGIQKGVDSTDENKEDTPFKLNLMKTVQRKTSKKKEDNWYSKYIAAERRDRVKWKSKLYRMEKSMWEKPLDEQAEHLMDESAEQFTKWVNSLGSKSGKEMTKDELKSLFAIEGNNCLLSSIQIDPRVVKALPQKVAAKWNMPEMAIELKYENYVNTQLKNAPRKDRTVSFGLTIPYKDRPWVQSMEDMKIETIFPDELCSGEHLFQGIVHLRSTKALIERCKKKPNIRRPKYLVENGYFKATSKKSSDSEEPLYELLKIT